MGLPRTQAPVLWMRTSCLGISAAVGSLSNEDATMENVVTGLLGAGAVATGSEDSTTAGQTGDLSEANKLKQLHKITPWKSLLLEKHPVMALKTKGLGLAIWKGELFLVAACRW